MPTNHFDVPAGLAWKVRKDIAALLEAHYAGTLDPDYYDPAAGEVVVSIVEKPPVATARSS